MISNRNHRHLGLCALGLVLLLAEASVGAPLLLNEYNAVRADRFLNGGDELADDDGMSATALRILPDFHDGLDAVGELRLETELFP